MEKRSCIWSWYRIILKLYILTFSFFVKKVELFFNYFSDINTDNLLIFGCRIFPLLETFWELLMMLKLIQGMYVFLKYTKIYSPTCASAVYTYQVNHLLSEAHKIVVLILNIDMIYTNWETNFQWDKENTLFRWRYF